VLTAGVLAAGVVTGKAEELGTETECTTSDVAGMELAAAGAVLVEPGVQSNPTL
jgi:hypothetical protein